MKYKLINLETKEEHLCDKVVIDGFDYYVSDEKSLSNNGDWYLGYPNYDTLFKWEMTGIHEGKQVWINKVIATNNPNIDVPRVVDKAELLAKNIYRDNPTDKKGVSYKYNTDINAPRKRKAFVKGYKKSQETHPFNEEDVCDFVEWKGKEKFEWNIRYNNWTSQLVEYSGCVYTTTQLLQLWKEQQPKAIYYNG